MGKYGPLPAAGTPERREFMRMIGRLGGLATASKIRGNIRAAMLEIANRIAETARQNVHELGLPADIADAIFLADVSDEGGDLIGIDIVVDIGDTEDVDDRRGRRAARAYEYGSGLRAERGSKEEIDIVARDQNNNPLAFLWEYPSPFGYKYINPYDEFVRFPSVIHPGVAPAPYLRPAIEAHRGEIKERLARAFKEAFVEASRAEDGG